MNDQEASSGLRQEKSSGKCMSGDPFICLGSFSFWDSVLVMHFLETKSAYMPAIIFDTLTFYELFLYIFSFSPFHPEASGSESEDDNDRHDAAEEETDDDDAAFFDTRDFLSSSNSFKSNGSDFRVSSFSSDDGLHAVELEEDVDPSIRSVGTNYPYVKRRKKLPDPIEKEKGVSLWSMIKDNIGKDLTKVCLPVYFNEPLSSLQKCCEEMEYSYLLDRAYEWGRRVGLDMASKFLVALFLLY